MKNKNYKAGLNAIGSIISSAYRTAQDEPSLELYQFLYVSFVLPDSREIIRQEISKQ